MSCYTREQIEATMASKGYKYFTGGDYDVNIVGVRNSETKGRVTNAFDDCMTVSYKVDGEWNFHCFKCTTDPGSHWVENIMREEGVAILKPGQYRGSHKLGLHQGKYLALRQQKPSKECVKVVVERYDHARVSVTTTNTCTNVIKVQTYLLVEWNKIQAEKKRKLRRRRAKRVKKV